MFMQDSSSQAYLSYQDPQIHLSATSFLKIYKRGPCCITVVIIFYSILFIPFQDTVAD